MLVFKNCVDLLNDILTPDLESGEKASFDEPEISIPVFSQKSSHQKNVIAVISPLS